MLLWRWEAIKTSSIASTPALRQLLQAAGQADTDLKRFLWQLAYEAHAQLAPSAQSSQEKLADIDELHLRKTLLSLKPNDWDWVEQMLTTMKLRAGLLIERAPSVFTFPHRTFQEYLAGAYLAAQNNFAKQATVLGKQGALWREVILLAVGRLIHIAGDIEKPLTLVNRLCPATSQGSPTAWAQTWLAGNVLLECGLKRVQADHWGQELYTRVRQRLVALVSQGHLPARERAEAGRTLAYLGDPRPGVCTLEPDMVFIPAGNFLMGEETYSITLEAFKIGRYPITNAQYRFFVEDGGYTTKWRAHWSQEGWFYREKYHWTQPLFWEDSSFNQPNQPVVGISWYEATAYVNWLSQCTGRNYRLPTEAEWERAARHTDGRHYPWGAKWHTGAANSKETGIGHPTAVGIFPIGTTISGVEDMIGNVWEWCQTQWDRQKGKEYPKPYKPNDGREDLNSISNIWRVRKGGAFNYSKDRLYCVYRHGFNMHYGDYYIGFRVVLPVSV